MEKEVLSGRCGCGEAEFSSKGFPSHLDYCYCTTCRQISGSAFGVWTGVKKDTIEWKGPIAKYRVSDIATRTLCVQCGASLSIQYDCYPEKTHVAAGIIAMGAELLPKVGVHIFVRSKPPWYTIPEDGVPQYDGFDPEFTAVQDRYLTQMGRKHPEYQPPQETGEHQSITTL